MTSSPGNNESEMDDLVVRAKSDREAFGALYDRFFPLVHRYCHRRLFDGVAADDVSSEVFLQVTRAMRRFPGTTELDFRRWVYRIATNAINAHLRQTMRRGELFERALRLGRLHKVETSSEPRDAAGTECQAVAQALAHLSPREQSVLTLRFVEGLSYEEVGQILGVRTATLRVAASRALKNLRRRLSSCLGSPVSQQEERPAS